MIAVTAAIEYPFDMTWTEWLQRGAELADQERWEEALAAHARARQRPGADARVVDYHRALVHLRRGHLEEALAVCPEQAPLALDGSARALRAELLARLGRLEEAAALARETLLDLPATDGRDAGRLHLVLARQGGERALEHALEALRHDAELEEAAAVVLRLHEGEPLARRYHLAVRGLRRGLFGRTEIRRAWQVVAATLEEALGLALMEEPRRVRRSLRVERHADLGPFPACLRGVLSRGATENPRPNIPEG